MIGPKKTPARPATTKDEKKGPPSKQEIMQRLEAQGKLASTRNKDANENKQSNQNKQSTVIEKSEKAEKIEKAQQNFSPSRAIKATTLLIEKPVPSINIEEMENYKSKIDSLNSKNETLNSKNETLTAKIENQNKTITKLKVETKSLKEENDNLKLELEEREKILKEATQKLGVSDDLLAKRNYFLTQKLAKLEKRVRIVENQIKTSETLFNEMSRQLDSFIEFVENNGEKDTVFRKVNEIYELFKVTKIRLKDLKITNNYNYGNIIHKDQITLLNDNSQVDESILKISSLQDRIDFEEAVFQLLSLSQSLNQDLVDKKAYNSSINLSYLSSKIVEFMIKEGFSVDKLSKVFINKSLCNNIEKKLSNFEYILSTYKGNSAVLNAYTEAQEEIDSLIFHHQIRDIKGYIESYIDGLEEDKGKRAFKNKETQELMEKVKKISTLQEVAYQTHQNLLTLCIIKQFDEFMNLKEYIEKELLETLKNINENIFTPFQDIYAAYQNYVQSGYDQRFAIHLASIFGTNGEKIMDSFRKSFSTLSNVKGENKDNFSLMVEAFKKKLRIAFSNIEK